MALSNDGRIFSCGLNEFGQLGLNNENNFVKNLQETPHGLVV